MKKNFGVAICAVFALMVVSSCLPQTDPVYQYLSTVTCKNNNGVIYFEESDNVALIADNLSRNPIPDDPEKRMLLAFITDNQPATPGVPGYEQTYNISITSMDTVYTKQPVASLGSKELDSEAFGDDPLGLYVREDTQVFPITSLEDGYLCVRFNFEYLPYSENVHEINLVTGANPEDPYELEIRHNAHGESVGKSSDGYIAFPLKSLPDTGGEVKTLTLIWNSSVTGQKEKVTFEYNTRTDWPM